MTRFLAISMALASAGALGACTTGAAYTLYTENDVFAVGNRDRYYTNGLRLTGMHRADAVPEPVRGIAEAIPSLSPNAKTQVGWVVGQDMYTPADTQADPPDPADRPYGGWLYTGVLVSKAVRNDGDPQGDRVDVVEADLGVVGPPALADQTQISYHHIIGSKRPLGWDEQLRFEPGAALQYEHRRRLLAGCESLLGGAWDAIGVAGATVGNVFTHGTVGGMLRWGTELRRDFGPNTIHSTAVDVPEVDPSHGARAYVFCGGEARLVGRNVFLDGNTFRDGPDVDSKPLVGELRTGAAVEWNGFRLAYTHVLRTKEFDGQPDEQAYGSIALTWGADF